MLAMGSKLEKVHSVCDVSREEVRGGGGVIRLTVADHSCDAWRRRREGERLFVSWEFKIIGIGREIVKGER